ncbi:hypothetical protein GCM10011396_24250 [Undibacterium terreum]|uniref:Uncharacterized protein n=1 Tax=Undibacterium terreum TaxID=1224302 RepID=A0A916XK09_9BURK|nr:hypothetical protein GCM10011396_24250 [Undibacterium terreum]
MQSRAMSTPGATSAPLFFADNSPAMREQLADNKSASVRMDLMSLIFLLSFNAHSLDQFT